MIESPPQNVQPSMTLHQDNSRDRSAAGPKVEFWSVCLSLCCQFCQGLHPFHNFCNRCTYLGSLWPSAMHDMQVATGIDVDERAVGLAGNDSGVVNSLVFQALIMELNCYCLAVSFNHRIHGQLLHSGWSAKDRCFSEAALSEPLPILQEPLPCWCRVPES